MTTVPSDTPEEAEVRAPIDDRVGAVRAGDVKQATCNIAPDILSFDVVNPLRSIGSEASRRRAETWFSSFHPAIGLEMRDLSITANGDVAFSHSLNRYSGTQTGGVAIDMWVRATTCYRKIDGEWAIVHEHQSVPFDGATGRASPDLVPTS